MLTITLFDSLSCYNDFASLSTYFIVLSTKNVLIKNTIYANVVKRYMKKIGDKVVDKGKNKMGAAHEAVNFPKWNNNNSENKNSENNNSNTPTNTTTKITNTPKNTPPQNNKYNESIQTGKVTTIAITVGGDLVPYEDGFNTNETSSEKGFNTDNADSQEAERKKLNEIGFAFFSNYCKNHPEDSICKKNTPTLDQIKNAYNFTNDNTDTNNNPTSEVNNNEANNNEPDPNTNISKGPQESSVNPDNNINPNKNITTEKNNDTDNDKQMEKFPVNSPQNIIDESNDNITTNKEDTTLQTNIEDNSELLKNLNNIKDLTIYLKEGINDTTKITEGHKMLFNNLLKIFHKDFKKKVEILKMQKSRNEKEYERLYPDKNEKLEEIQKLIKEFSTEQLFSIEKYKEQITNRQKLILLLENKSNEISDKELIEIGRLSMALSYRDAEFDGNNYDEPEYKNVKHYEKHSAGFVINGELFKDSKGNIKEIEKISLNVKPMDVLKLVGEKEFVGGIIQITEDKFQDMFTTHGLLSHIVMAVRIENFVYLVGYCTSDKDANNILLSPNQPFNKNENDKDKDKPQMFKVLKNLTVEKCENFTEKKEVTEYLKSDEVYKILLQAINNAETDIINNPINTVPILKRNDFITLLSDQLKKNYTELEATKSNLEKKCLSNPKAFEATQKKKEEHYNLMKLQKIYKKMLSENEKAFYEYYLHLKKKVDLINKEEKYQQDMANKKKHDNENNKPPYDIS